MKERRLFNWEDKVRDHSLLFFTQLIEELLFYYTIDSFRLPAHNTNTLISEAIKTIEHINDGILKDGSLDSIKQEIVDTIGKDRSVAKILSSDIEILIQSLNTSKNDNAYSLLKYIHIQLKKYYYDQLVKDLKIKIQNNDYDDLVRTTKYLLIEILNNGYSIDYINTCNNKIFMKKVVAGIDSYDKFISCFNTENKDFTVILNATTHLSKFSEYFNKDVIQLKDKPEISQNDNISPRIKNFIDLDGSFVHIYTKAKDCFKAFSKARFTTENILANITFLQHQGSYSTSTEGIIVENDNNIYYSGQNNPMFRRPDILKDEKIKNKFNVVIKSILAENFDDNSKKRLLLSYHRHLSSIRSLSYENQLVDLWSGIEILIPLKNKDSSDKIKQILDVMIPVLTDRYIKKIITYIFQAIKRSSVRRDIFKILKRVDENYEVALEKCIMLDSNNAEYLDIISKFETYPLLQKRIEYYHNKLSNQKEIGLLIKNHQKRVGWQIQRIYRGRNLIIHAGKTPYQLETLIENLHYYFDILLNAVIHSVSDSVTEITLDNIYIRYKFKNEKFIKYLDKNKKNELSNEMYSIIMGNT